MLKLVIVSAKGFEVLTFEHEPNARHRLNAVRDDKKVVAVFLYDKYDQLMVATNVRF